MSWRSHGGRRAPSRGKSWNARMHSDFKTRWNPNSITVLRSRICTTERDRPRPRLHAHMDSRENVQAEAMLPFRTHGSLNIIDIAMRRAPVGAPSGSSSCFESATDETGQSTPGSPKSLHLPEIGVPGKVMGPCRVASASMILMKRAT